MSNTRIVASIGIATMLLSGTALAQADLTCDDIEWSSVVTSEYPSIADACDAVVVKNDKMYARVQVELQRVRGRSLTFKILNNDGSSGGSYTTQVDSDWRAEIGGRSYRANQLERGQQLNVYMPHDRWAVIQEDADGPDDSDATELAAAPMLPKTASPLPLFAMAGAGFLVLAAGLGAIRRRLLKA